MVRALIAAERRLLFRDPAVLIGAVFLLLFTALAAGLGAARVDGERATIAAVRAEQTRKQATLLADAVKAQATPPTALADPHKPGGPPPGSLAGAVGLRELPVPVVLEPAPLAALAVGLSDVRPSIYRLTARPPHTVRVSYELENPLTMAAGVFDVAFVILFLMPMVILAANYNLLSGDRDSGVMALALAQPTPPRAYVSARMAVRSGAVFALAAAAWAIALMVGRVELAAPGAAPAAAALLAVIQLYAAFWMVLVLLVNLLVRSSGACGVLLASLWLLFVVGVPTVIALVASTSISAPSRLLLTAEARQAAQAADRAQAKTLEAFFVDHPDMAAAASRTGPGGADVFSLATLASDDAVERAVRPRLDAFDQAVARRQALVETLQVLSPPLIAQIAIEDLAGRGAWRYGRFTAASGAFHKIWSAFFVPRILGSGKMTPEDYATLPRWRFAGTASWPLSPFNSLALAVLAGIAAAGLGWSRLLVDRMKP